MFAPEFTYGNKEDFVPPLLRGFKKFPVQQKLIVALPNSVPFTPDAGDMVAVFTGDECRGVGLVDKAFTAFRTSSGEVLQLRYYSKQKGGVYTFRQSVEDTDITLFFLFSLRLSFF